jgi:hypothetical protein
LQLDHLDALRGSGVGRRRGQAVGVDGGPELGDGVAVQRADLTDDLAVVDQQEPPVLGVAPGGARMAASRIWACTSAGTGSGRTLRMARVV